MLNVLPKAIHGKAKQDLHAIYEAESRKAAEKAFDLFIDKYGAKYDKAVACLAKDRQALLAFYDFPAEHWKHVPTSNPIESTFATVRPRTAKTGPPRPRAACHARPPLPWSSSSPSRPNGIGVASTAPNPSVS